MQHIINFIIRNKNFLLFLLLLCIGLSLVIQSHSYHKSKFINSANIVSGGIYETSNNISSYFSLKKENDILIEENKRLKSIVYNTQDTLLKDSVLGADFSKKYKFSSARVSRNSYALTNNYLNINKGRKDSIKEDFGVITSKGIVGVIDRVSKHYSRVLSILNASSRVNAQLKTSHHFGILKWNGTHPNTVQLTDIPKQASFSVGDTIITGGKSTIFPKGITIGSIVSSKLDETENYYIIDVLLFNDMTNLNHVYIIENRHAEEISNLNNPNE